jgi:hypothetical protein
MQLNAAIDRYLQVAGSFGRPMALDQFGLARPEVEEMLSAWEEDYHLNRYFELVSAAALSGDPSAYVINGALYTAIIIQETIRDVLQ